jgi:NAD(P)-dependent dehydrogenase (short-subunit alcohol dehydrogenase family)
MTHDVFRLDGRVGVVTGGGRGLGKAIALALAGAGADVWISYRESEAAVRDLIRDIEALGRRAGPHAPMSATRPRSTGWWPRCSMKRAGSISG